MNIKEKYKNEINSVSFSNNFNSVVTLRVIEENRRKGTETLNKKKAIKILALVAALIVLLSTSVYAVTYLLSAKDVAENVGAENVAKLFNEENFDIVTISDKGYNVSYHGVVNGEELTYIDDTEVYENRTYAVFSIAKVDGTKLSLIDGMPLQFAPIIEGMNPLTVWSLGFGAQGMEKDGILYYLFDFQDLEIFADKKVSVAVFEGNFPGPDILSTNENGQTVYSETYNGFKGEFELKMDKSKANPEKAKELLESIGLEF